MLKWRVYNPNLRNLEIEIVPSILILLGISVHATNTSATYGGNKDPETEISKIKRCDHSSVGKLGNKTEKEQHVELGQLSSKHWYSTDRALRREVVTLGREKTQRASIFPLRCFHISYPGKMMHTQRRNEFWGKGRSSSLVSVPCDTSLPN